MFKQDNKFLEELYIKYRKSIWGYAYHLTSDADLADEITQNVFSMIIRHLGTLKKVSEISVKAYLNTVTRNLVNSHYRKKTDYVAFEEIENNQEYSTKIITLEEYYGVLSSREKDLIVLRYEYQLSYKDIGDITGLTVSHVGVILNRISTKLRQMLEGDR